MIAYLQRCEAEVLISRDPRPMFVCRRPCWMRLILAIASSSCATHYGSSDEVHHMLMRLHHTRSTEQTEIADAAIILARWE